MLDKYFVRKVNELMVVCKHKDKGCSWQGDVIALKGHLDPVKGNCKYMSIGCPYFCGAIMNYNELEKHQKNCHRRPYSCKFCGYKGVYEDMSAKHWKMCDKYPLACMNKCGEVDIERGSMEKHLREICPLQKNNCEFEYAGCSQCLNNTDMSEHLANSLQLHLSLVSKHCLNLSRTFPAELRSQMEEEMKVKDSENKQLQLKLKEYEDQINVLQSKVASIVGEMYDIKTDVTHLKTTVFVPPFEFILTDFRKHKQNQQQWLSPPFYTHFGGYKMCISVDASGSDEGEGTHVSVYSNLMKGEYDSHLKWPFTGCIEIELLNQRENSGHFQEKILYTYDASEIACRVIEGEVAASGLGIPTFIKHTALGYNPKKGIEYLKNDCLHFKVVGVQFRHRSKSNQGLK